MFRIPAIVASGSRRGVRLSLHLPHVASATIPLQALARDIARHLPIGVTSSAALRDGLVVNIRTHSRSFHVSAGMRQASGDAAASGKGPAAGEAGEGAKVEEEIPIDEGPPLDEPFVARLSRFVWNTIKFSLGMGIVSLVLYAGYTIVITLLPAGASANAIMRRASDVLKHDPEISSYFGDIKTYGEDFGSSREGRRYFVPDYTYVDDLTDVKYHRIKFNMEGERAKKAEIWAEVRHGTYDFRYIIAVTKDKSRVWSLLDNRPPARTLEDRQGSVTSIIQDGGWKFYTDNDVDIAEQSAHLGDYWLKVRTVRCDRDVKECEDLGITSRPAWAIRKPASVWERIQGKSEGEMQVIKGVRTLHELEMMTKELRKKQAGNEGVVDKFKKVIGM